MEETFDAAPAVEAILERHPTRAGRGRGARRRLPGEQRLPGRRAVRRDDPHRRGGPRLRAGQPGDHPRPRGHRRRLRHPGPGARPARHRLRRRLDRLARPRAGRGLQGLRPRPRRRAARRRRRRRAGHRRRAQRHRDARVGRPRGGHGTGGPAGHRRRRRRHRSGRRGRRRGRARRSTSDGARRGRRHRAAARCRCGPPTTSRRSAAGTRSPGWHPQFPREDDVDAASIWRDGDPWASRVDHASRTWSSARSASSGPRSRPRTATPEVEVGYGLVEAARGAGYATEALTALLARGRRRPAYGSAPACCPDNAASIRVLAKCGFTELRGSNEDGELVMARPLRVSQPKLVATDLDGTLVDSDGTSPTRTREVLDRLDERWASRVVFVTARPLRWMRSSGRVVGGTASASSPTARSSTTSPQDRIHELEGIEVEAGLAPGRGDPRGPSRRGLRRRAGVRLRATSRRSTSRTTSRRAPVRAGRGGAVRRSGRQGAGRAPGTRPGRTLRDVVAAAVR